MDLQQLQPWLDRVLSYVSPGWVLAVLLAALNVCVFHITAAQESRSLFYFLPFGLFGFALGNLLAVLFHSPLPMLGDLHVIEACLGAWMALMLANSWPRPATP